ncbi:hypothetical protein [Alicyclobacillus sp. SO9]|uniref:hypothetical protein n=1 Tax=Alicyclobacillus sp. SO9 TaxID=2665646 RepID=UPI0018E899E6|nr:hypothetical protein [Alicyclobacillus sp. SO9]QQE78099.1 hypothetical protein GI364_19735 [Alicyclobacillus sp. SO9]
MQLTIPDSIKENIFKYRFVELLRRHKKPFSGKPSIWERLEQAVNDDDNFYGALQQFIVDEISNGKNRQVFWCDISIESLNILSNYSMLQSNLAAQNLPLENFNSFLSSNTPTGNMVYLNIERDSSNTNKVHQISFCYLQDSVAQINDDDGVEMTVPGYVWIDIFPDARYLQIKVRPYSYNYIVNLEESKKVFDHYWEFLRKTFEIVYTDMSDTKLTLYEIFKELTEKAEAPFRRAVEEKEPRISAAMLDIAKELELENISTPVDLTNRVSRLFERALILNDLKQYKGYNQGKLGIVDRIDFSDQSGARVNALSGEQGMEVADIYFDTRETLDELKMLNKLWVTWFRPTKDEEGYDDIDRIETRLEVYDNRIVFYFLNTQHAPKEVQDYVLSVFRKFKEGEIPSTID